MLLFLWNAEGLCVVVSTLLMWPLPSCLSCLCGLWLDFSPAYLIKSMCERACSIVVAVPSSNSRGSRFDSLWERILALVKKILSPLHTPKHRSKDLPSTHMGLCDPCVRVGEGFGDFLSLHEVFFY
jgi:hypothetical protein